LSRNSRPAADECLLAGLIGETKEEQSPMTKREFQNLLQIDREAAVRTLIDRKVDDWFNDGLPEIKRVLTLWAANQADAPRLDLGPDELILEMAENCQLIDGESA
jgi:hypothetical protein